MRPPSNRVIPIACRVPPSLTAPMLSRARWKSGTRIHYQWITRGIAGLLALGSRLGVTLGSIRARFDDLRRQLACLALRVLARHAGAVLRVVRGRHGHPPVLARWSRCDPVRVPPMRKIICPRPTRTPAPPPRRSLQIARLVARCRGAHTKTNVYPVNNHD
jgi:hypothetical protein